MQEALEVSFPGTNLEVEIVLTILLRRRGLRACSRCGWLLLCESMKRMTDDNQAPEQEKSSQLDEQRAAAGLDSIMADSDDHGFPPQADWSNLISNSVEMEYSLTHELYQEGTFR
jgi:hypothetical protein